MIRQHGVVSWNIKKRHRKHSCPGWRLWGRIQTGHACPCSLWESRIFAHLELSMRSELPSRLSQGRRLSATWAYWDVHKPLKLSYLGQSNGSLHVSLKLSVVGYSDSWPCVWLSRNPDVAAHEHTRHRRFIEGLDLHIF